MRRFIWTATALRVATACDKAEPKIVARPAAIAVDSA